MFSWPFLELWKKDVSKNALSSYLIFIINKNPTKPEPFPPNGKRFTVNVQKGKWQCRTAPRGPKCSSRLISENLMNPKDPLSRKTRVKHVHRKQNPVYRHTSSDCRCFWHSTFLYTQLSLYNYNNWIYKKYSRTKEKSMTLTIG